MTPTSWQQTLHKLARDRERGASQLVTDAYDALLDAFADATAFDPDALRRSLTEFRFGQPAMAPVLNLTATYGHLLDNPADDLDRNSWIKRLRKQVAGEREAHLLNQEAMLERFAGVEFPGERIGFYSWSSTVAGGLRKHAKYKTPRKAFISKSLPGGEGNHLAELLAKLGWQVWLVNDMHFADMALRGKLDALILGCDALNESLFVNKVGSGALAALMRDAGKHVEIWTTLDKRLPTHDILELDLGDKETLPSIATGMATPEPLFGLASLQDVNLIRTPSGDITTADLNAKPLPRTTPIPHYLKLENRPR